MKLTQAQEFIRLTLMSNPTVAASGAAILPVFRGSPKLAVVYRSLGIPNEVASTDGQSLYGTFYFQVCATCIGDTVSPLVAVADAIKSDLHFDQNRRALLPAGIRSCQVEREIEFVEPSSTGEVRQNLGVVIRIMI